MSLSVPKSAPGSRKRHREDTSSGSEADSSGSDEEYGKKKGARPLTTISNLLSSANLEAELDALRSDREGVAGLKGKRIVLPDLIHKLLNSNDTNNVISSLLKFPQPDERTAITRVNRLITTVESIPELARAQEQLGIVGRMVQWDLCRAHLILYEWFRTGPSLAKDLVILHNRSIVDLERQFPAFAPLVKTVVAYAKYIQTSSAQLKKKRKTTETSSISHSAPTSLPLTEVPSNLHGLLPNPKKTGAVKLPAIAKVGAGDIELVKAAVQCLFDLLSREMVVIPMAPVDKHWMSPQRRVAQRKAQAETATGSPKNAAKSSPAMELQKVQARIIARGAVLHCISQVCGGESIFASHAMHEVLLCPTSLFPSKWHEDTRFMAAILRNETKTLATLITPLESLISSDPDIVKHATDLAGFVHRRMLEFHRGRPISEEEFLNPDVVVENVTSLAAPTAKEPRRKHIPRINLTPAQLLGSDGFDDTTESKPLLAKLALIIREALNERQNLGPCNQSLRWILEGRHAGTGAESKDRDLTDPVRLFSVNAQLLKEKIPSTRVTGALGFSNLLAWQLTGQGGGTQTFLDTQDTMFFESLDECLQVFGDAHARNTSLKEEYRKEHPHAADDAVDTAVKRQPGYLPTHNPNVYGEAANSLGLTPTRRSDGEKCTLEEKFRPFYELDVQERWGEFLGDMAGQDPKTFTGKKRTWKEALDFIQEFGFYGLKSDGLTALQMANNLVVLGVCEEPDPESMAAWVSGRGELGAFKGLKLLGFNLNASDPLATRTAFICVYDHLFKHLSREAKECLGFGVIFVEHALCKVKRWTSYYDAAMRQSSFQSIADELIHRLPGPPLPHECLPFPIEVTIDELQMAIDKAKV
ncbi:hypothetical protein C8R47DRAFT_1165537 [Mycena vitilis]|nr:hypothetical protein C8R47DRAFT_1165537 [Mycena vitilis]